MRLNNAKIGGKTRKPNIFEELESFCIRGHNRMTYITGKRATSLSRSTKLKKDIYSSQNLYSEFLIHETMFKKKSSVDNFTVALKACLSGDFATWLERDVFMSHRKRSTHITIMMMRRDNFTLYFIYWGHTQLYGISRLKAAKKVVDNYFSYATYDNNDILFLTDTSSRTA